MGPTKWKNNWMEARCPSLDMNQASKSLVQIRFPVPFPYAAPSAGNLFLSPPPIPASSKTILPLEDSPYLPQSHPFTHSSQHQLSTYSAPGTLPDTGATPWLPFSPHLNLSLHIHLLTYLLHLSHFIVLFYFFSRVTSTLKAGTISY